ncbi:MAG TPA: hypothetical protein VEX39_07790 [Thermoleophilaceae bacterium]|nr:hypothetical protein [Thermoleophilaceae bacterium]
MSPSQAEAYHFEDFTEDAYRRMLEVARERYEFAAFGSSVEGPHVLWRHDVDFSVHRALALAEIESDLGVTSTFFLLLHSQFYNLLEADVRDKAVRIAGLGHRIGLHFDAGYYGGIDSAESLGRKLAWERELLSATVGSPVDAFAFHIPEVTGTAKVDEDHIGGMVNAGGRTLRERYSYVSDSNGYWRHRRLPEVIAEGTEERLHVLTHPGWWQPTAMSPRERLSRCVDGRARSSERWYDELVAAWGRENIR